MKLEIANDEQNHLAKYIKDFESKTRPQDSNLTRIKKDVLNSAMALLKGREMVFKGFASGISEPSEQSEQLEQSDQSSSDDKCTSLKLNNGLNASSSASNNSFPSD